MDSLRKHESRKNERDSAGKEDFTFGEPWPPLSRSPSLSGKGLGKRAAWSFLFLFLVTVLSAGGFLLYRIVSTTQAISLENTPGISFVSSLKNLTRSFYTEGEPLRGEKEGRINILLLGRAGERYPGRNLTDTVMIASIDTKSRKVALLSLPRDLYAPIPETGLFTKLNSLYQYGLHQNRGAEPLRESVTAMTGLPIHYFVLLDFDGFEKIVDILGGVRVEVKRDIYDTRYPGKNYSYETFELKKGWQTLDGKTALKYVRERHDDPEGDFGRAKRQQEVMQALKDQVFSLQTFLNIFTVDKLLAALGENVRTDLTLNNMESLLLLSKKLDTHNVTTLVVDAWKKESLLRTSHVMAGDTRVFILVPRVGNFSEIRDVAENIFQLDVLAERKNAIRKEAAQVLILSEARQSATAAKVSSFLRQELGFGEVSSQSLPPGTQLKNPRGESIIVDMAGLATPFSLDELLKRLPLQKKERAQLPLLPKSSSPPDIVIIVGTDLEEVIAVEENVGREEPTLESEELPPQPGKLP